MKIGFGSLLKLNVERNNSLGEIGAVPFNWESKENKMNQIRWDGKAARSPSATGPLEEQWSSKVKSKPQVPTPNLRI